MLEVTGDGLEASFEAMKTQDEELEASKAEVGALKG